MSNFGRWHATVASSYLEANAGLQYVFGDISGALRSRMRYTQRQIDGLGTAKVRQFAQAARGWTAAGQLSLVGLCIRLLQPAAAA